MYRYNKFCITSVINYAYCSNLNMCPMLRSHPIPEHDIQKYKFSGNFHFANLSKMQKIKLS